MMYGWWDGSPAPWYGMIFGPIMMIAFIVLTVLLIAWALRAFGLGWQSDSREKALRSILSSTASHVARLTVQSTRIAGSCYPIRNTAMIIANDPPYGTERVYNVLRLVEESHQCRRVLRFW